MKLFEQKSENEFYKYYYIVQEYRFCQLLSFTRLNAMKIFWVKIYKKFLKFVGGPFMSIQKSNNYNM